MTQGQLVSRVANSYKTKRKIMKHKTYHMLVPATVA